MTKIYRDCVLAVLSDSNGKLLVGERSNPRGAWQFPQGGIDADESPEEALRRELIEEIGLTSFVIVEKLKEPIYYDFPQSLKSEMSEKFRGQQQIWFHIKCEENQGPDLKKATDQEFISLEWVSAEEAIHRIVFFKKDSYIRGLKNLGLIS